MTQNVFGETGGNFHPTLTNSCLPLAFSCSNTYLSGGVCTDVIGGSRHHPIRVPCGWLYKVHPHTPLQVVCYASNGEYTNLLCSHSVMATWLENKRIFITEALSASELHTFINLRAAHTHPPNQTHRSQSHRKKPVPSHRPESSNTHISKEGEILLCVQCIHAHTKMPHAVAFRVKHLLFRNPIMPFFLLYCLIIRSLFWDQCWKRTKTRLH